MSTLIAEQPAGLATPEARGYLNFWGKARPSAERAHEASWHPLAYHSLDVAAVVSAFLDKNPAISRRLSILLDMPETGATSLLVFLAAAHDLGKFNLAFQAKAPETFALLFPGQGRPEEINTHSATGLTTLLEHLAAQWFPDSDIDDAERILEPLANAACGHHGLPEALKARTLKGAAGKAASAFLADLRLILGMKGSPWTALPVEERLRDASWLAAGVITLCDWVGSSQTFFPYQEPIFSLDEYWEETQFRAANAIRDCGLSEKRPSGSAGFDWLFGNARAHSEPGYAPKSPTPMQVFADTVRLPATPEPVLLILEDETGAGKTEAALTLASRMVSKGFGRGVFFSLPTQTTANAVFERIEPLVSRFFDEGHSPTLTLAHGQAKLAMARLKEARADEGSISADLDAWAQESSKTALLSDFGVGTVDQVAMAGLPVRHVVMRHLGLAEKVLIVDEAHACEPYLLAILQNALKQHARLGGSAIILSATLPRATKQALVDAFTVGKGMPGQSALVEDAYPLATFVSSEQHVERAIEARSIPRSLELEGIDEATAFARIEDLLLERKCVCLMRNTVHSAQSAFDHFDARFPGVVSLAHARFMLGDRGENDHLLLQSFGKDSTQGARQGRLVIATQVAEQSLDVDFDEMFTDLAPIDSLLQRAGRKCRHRRDAQGNPATVDSRAVGPLYVLMPTDIASERFMAELPFGTAYVYPMPGVLLRTAQIVKDWKSLSIPTDVRRAVEFAYDAEASVPTHLDNAEAKAHGKALAASQHARISRLRLECGYSVEAGIDGSAHSVTRLGEPSVAVVLCDETGRPLRSEKNHSVETSQISLRASLIARADADKGPVDLRMTETSPGHWSAFVQDSRRKPFTARYTRARGFSMEH